MAKGDQDWTRITGFIGLYQDKREGWRGGRVKFY